VSRTARWICRTLLAVAALSASVALAETTDSLRRLDTLDRRSPRRSRLSKQPNATAPVDIAMGDTLQIICARKEPVFADACGTLPTLSSRVLQHIAPQQSGAQAKVAIEAISLLTRSLTSRLAELRHGASGLSFQEFSLDFHGLNVPMRSLAHAVVPLWGGAGEGNDALPPTPNAGGEGDAAEGGLSGGFFSGSLGSGRRPADETGLLGFGLHDRSVTLGTDRRIGGGFIGAAAGSSSLGADLGDAGGHLGTSSYTLSVYGTRPGLFGGEGAGAAGPGAHYDGAYLDGAFMVARQRYESRRLIDVPGLPAVLRALSSNNANVFALMAGGGIDAHRGGLALDTSLRGTWTAARIGGYSERGADPLDLAVEAQTIHSALATAQVDLTYTWSAGWGVLRPSLSGSLVHELKNAARTVGGHFLSDPGGTPFAVPLDRVDANYGHLDAAVQALFPHGFSAFVHYGRDAHRSDLHFRTIDFGVRKEF
jgi:hypothetical protein